MNTGSETVITGCSACGVAGVESRDAGLSALDDAVAIRLSPQVSSSEVPKGVECRGQSLDTIKRESMKASLKAPQFHKA